MGFGKAKATGEVYSLNFQSSTASPAEPGDLPLELVQSKQRPLKVTRATPVHRPRSMCFHQAFILMEEAHTKMGKHLNGLAKSERILFV
jgi:hypothetical protein